MIENIYYVYVWIDPRNKLPFYVGKGKGNRAYSKFHKHRNQFFNRKVNSIENNGFIPEVKLIKENLTEKEAFVLESELIEKYKRVEDGGILTNLKVAYGLGETHTSKHTIETLSKKSSGESNGMSKFTNNQINEVFDYILAGYDNQRIEKILNIPSHIISDLRYGKKWKHLYDKHDISKYPTIKSNGHTAKKYDLQWQIDVIGEIVNRREGILFKDIAKKYNLSTNKIININLKRTWRVAWEYYESGYNPNDYRKRIKSGNISNESE